MKAGRYFEHPDRAMLAKLKSAEDFRGLELAEVRFQTKCTGKGIHLPKFIFSADGQRGNFSTNKEKAALENSVKIPQTGFSHVMAKVTQNYVRALCFTAGTVAVMVTVTGFDDGVSHTTPIDPSIEIVGYYGYMDDDGFVMGIGLIGF